MTKDKFRHNLSSAIASLMHLTGSLCSNSFSSNYRFIMRPNALTLDPHLDQEEITFHKKIMTYRDKHVSDNEVVDLLWVNNKVPLWINTSVLESSDTWTTIELVTSRRLRAEEQLNEIVDQFPPFHVQIPLPSDRVEGVKFDVNWRTGKRGREGIWQTIRRLFVK